MPRREARDPFPATALGRGHHAPYGTTRTRTLLSVNLITRPTEHSGPRAANRGPLGNSSLSNCTGVRRLCDALQEWALGQGSHVAAGTLTAIFAGQELCTTQIPLHR